MKLPCSVFVFVLLCSACARSPTGRPQLRLVGDDQMTKMGLEAFDEVKSETPETKDSNASQYVACVAKAVTAEAKSEGDWEVRVFESKEVNAFALPGGKIGVYTGLLGVTANQDQLATVLAHEVAHVTAKHGNARVSSALATNAGLELTSAFAGKSTPMKREALGLLGLGAQVGILLPYGRDQETEADVIGLDLMAKSGFDPRASVELWRNMAKATGDKQPPTFLSTHPSHEGRIEELSARMPAAQQHFVAAREAGKAPRCRSAGAERSAQALP